jgi:hypothetical protein
VFWSALACSGMHAEFNKKHSKNCIIAMQNEENKGNNAIVLMFLVDCDEK